jgi:hypothetical protein
MGDGKSEITEMHLARRGQDRPELLRSLILDWQRELKNRASWHVCCRPQTSLMSLDNRTTNR